MIRHVFYAVLIARLLVDMATPLMPGAFRFDPHESIEALHSHATRAIGHAEARANSPFQKSVAQVTASPIMPAVPVVARDPRATAPRGPLLRIPADTPPESTEDH